MCQAARRYPLHALRHFPLLKAYILNDKTCTIRRDILLHTKESVQPGPKTSSRICPLNNCHHEVKLLHSFPSHMLISIPPWKEGLQCREYSLPGSHCRTLENSKNPPVLLSNVRSGRSILMLIFNRITVPEPSQELVMLLLFKHPTWPIVPASLSRQSLQLLRK